jgi:hypothetical protein
MKENRVDQQTTGYMGRLQIPSGDTPANPRAAGRSLYLLLLPAGCCGCCFACCCRLAITLAASTSSICASARRLSPRP